MSHISGLLRETGGPDYKKAALVVAVTAGTGALVYGGYRYWQHAKPVNPSKGKDLTETESSTKSKQTSTTQERPPVPKPEERSVLELPKSPKPTKIDELSVSGTFEKISYGGNNGSDNFEHVTLSQVQPVTPPEISPVMSKTAEQSFSLLTMSQMEETSHVEEKLQVEEISKVDEPQSFSLLTMSQVEEPIVSFVSTTETSAEPIFEHEQQERSEHDILAIHEESERHEEKEVRSEEEVQSLINVKDENDIIVIEKTSQIESSEDTIEPIEALHDFDSSRVSPVFGGASFHPVNVDEQAFDPSTTHPSTFGYEFEKEE